MDWHAVLQSVDVQTVLLHDYDVEPILCHCNLTTYKGPAGTHSSQNLRGCKYQIMIWMYTIYFNLILLLLHVDIQLPPTHTKFSMESIATSL